MVDGRQSKIWRGGSSTTQDLGPYLNKVSNTARGRGLGAHGVHGFVGRAERGGRSPI